MGDLYVLHLKYNNILILTLYCSYKSRRYHTKFSFSYCNINLIYRNIIAQFRLQVSLLTLAPLSLFLILSILGNLALGASAYLSSSYSSTAWSGSWAVDGFMSTNCHSNLEVSLLITYLSIGSGWDYLLQFYFTGVSLPGCHTCS